MYYEDRRTGGIYSIRELGAQVRREHIPLDELARGLRPLPYATCLLLEEAEAIAAKAEEEQERAWLNGLF